MNKRRLTAGALSAALLTTMLPGLAGRYGQRILLVLGGSSFQNSPAWQPLQQGLLEPLVGRLFQRRFGSGGVGAADDVRDRHVVIIDHDRQVIGR